MTRNSALVTGLTVLGLAFSGQAAADDGVYRCAHNAPGSPLLTCLPAGDGALREVPSAPVVEPPRTLATRTHNFMVPTGELTPKGDIPLGGHELIYNTVAFGVTDHFELSVSAPIIPVFAGAGARLGLTSRSSSLRLVVGGDVYFPLMDDVDSLLLQATATVAYRTDRFNLHGTISLIKPTDADDGEALGIVTAGMSYQFHKKAAFLAEMVRLSMYDSYESCYDAVGTDGTYHSDCSSATDADSIVAPMLGFKLMGRHFDTDLGLVFPAEVDRGEFIAIPVISMTYQY